MRVLFFILVLFFSARAECGEVLNDGPKCDRTIAWDGLVAVDKEKLLNGEQITFSVTGDSGYNFVYSEKIITADPEAVAAVYGRVEYHAGASGLGTVIKSATLLDEKSEPQNKMVAVDYEHKVPFPYGDSQYVASVVLTQNADGYIFNSKALSASDKTFSPKWLDAYLKIERHEKGSFIVACNYTETQGGDFKSAFNSIAETRLKKSLQSLSAWVRRVTVSPLQREKYLEVFRERFGKTQ